MLHFYITGKKTKLQAYFGPFGLVNKKKQIKTSFQISDPVFSERSNGNRRLLSSFLSQKMCIMTE